MHATETPPAGDRGLLRPRHDHAHAKVSFVELFFDLVFVFAVTQLSHLLIGHFSPLGAAQTALLLLAVWWVWIFTSWVTNWLEPEKLPVRLLLLGLMAAGLVLSASIPTAFTERGFGFAGAYVAMQVGRTLFVLWAARGHAGLVCNFQRILAWLVASGALWLAGAGAEGPVRFALWAAALAVEYVAPSLGFFVPGLGRSTTRDWNVEGAHIAERCALFVIIALGESVLVTGATFSAMAWTPAAVAAFFTSLLGSLAMWWLYFDTSAEAGSRRIAGSRDPGRLARLAYTYLHLLLVAGIIVSAVADEFVLAHPTGHSDAKTTATVLVSNALFLLGGALFRRVIAGRLPWSPLVGIAGLALLAPVAAQLAPVALLAVANALLVAVAAWEAHARRYCPPAEPSVSLEN